MAPTALSPECRVLDTNTLVEVWWKFFWWKNLDQNPKQKQIFVLDVLGQLVFKGNSPEEEGNRVVLLCATLVFVTLGEKATPSL